MSTPVVVQGTPVANPHHSSGPSDTNFTGKGEKQESKCRDPIFAALFYVCLIAIVIVAFTYGPDAMTADDAIDHEYNGYVTATVIIVIFSFLGAAGGLAVMMRFPETLIKAALIFVTVLAGIWMVMAFLSGEIVMGILGAVFFAISLCYARAVWSRIPFATANLVTACTAIRSNLGVTIYAYIFTAIAGVWSITWSVAFAGVFDHTYECDEFNVCSNPNYGFLFLLFVAYFFINQVLQVRERWDDSSGGHVSFLTPSLSLSLYDTYRVPFTVQWLAQLDIGGLLRRKQIVSVHPL
jgi:hypothetical protein